MLEALVLGDQARKRRKDPPSPHLQWQGKKSLINQSSHMKTLLVIVAA